MARPDSIATTQPGGWHEIDGISEPIEAIHPFGQTEPATPTPAATITRPGPAKPKREYNVPPYLAYPPVPYSAPAVQSVIGSAEVELPADTAAVDTLRQISPEEQARLDSIARERAGERLQPIVLINPLREEVAPASPVAAGKTEGMSWVYLILGILFCVSALRFKNSRKQLGHLWNDLTDTRLRHNMFDDTVKETSFIVLLNVLWAASAGVMLWKLLDYRTMQGAAAGGSFGLRHPESVGIAICAGLSGLYLIGLLIAYWGVGRIFTDRRRTQLWIKGATSSTALETFLLFPTALLLLCYPAWTGWLLLVGGIVFLLGKMLFFSKGFRIFFNQISSLLLFLYYLCSLEIVPVVIVYITALSLC